MNNCSIKTTCPYFHQIETWVVIMYPIGTMDSVNYFRWNIVGIIDVFFWPQSEVNRVFHKMESLFCCQRWVCLGLTKNYLTTPTTSTMFDLVWSIACMKILTSLFCLYFLNTWRTTPPIPIICIIWVFNNISYIQDGLFIVFQASPINMKIDTLKGHPRD